MDALSEYVDLETFLGRYPQFTKSQMRWLVVKKRENGLASGIKKVGRKLYFNTRLFREWLEYQNA